MLASRRTAAMVAAPFLALGAAAALVPSMSVASSHREAPAITEDPKADSTDVYAFTSPDDPGSATLVANYVPFEEPAGGPNFYGLSDTARYLINIDNTGDGQADISYRVRTHTRTVNDESFLYATGPITYDDAARQYKNLNVVQTYDVSRVTYRPDGRVQSVTEVGRNLLSPPNNAGPKSTPNYATALVPPSIHALKGGGKVFVGQRDDPFFVDLGSTFDLVNIDAPGRTGIGLGDQGGGDDGLTGYSVHSIVLQIPKSQLTRDGRTPTDANSTSSVVGVWTEAQRFVPGALVKHGKRTIRTGQWATVARLGNPLVNEVVIPLGEKDRWNATPPRYESKFLKYYTDPELAKAINGLFPGAVNAPTTNRQDLVTVLLKGLPPGNATGLVNQVGDTPVVADMLRLNLATPVAATPNRLGAVGGDAAGFPNGRRLADDVVDIELKAVAGALASVFGLPAPTANAAKLGDGVDANDQAFLPGFPYLATPLSGFEVKHPRPAN